MGVNKGSRDVKATCATFTDESEDEHVGYNNEGHTDGDEVHPCTSK